MLENKKNGGNTLSILNQVEIKSTNSPITNLMVTLYRCGNFLPDVDVCSVAPSQVHNLGVIIESTVSFQSHIKLLTKSAFYDLKHISRLWPSL